jgi:tryptophanyl-tRNA synthetase
MGDPGNPDICPIFALHRYFSPADDVARVDRTCRTGELGCVEDKGFIAERLIEVFAPFRERRAELAAQPGLVERVLREGAERARPVARATLDAVRGAMHFP